MAQQPAILRFTKLELQNWRNFGSTNIGLARRVFIVGPNASGKSNFLDVFRFLRDIVSVGGGFQAAVEKRGGISSIRALHARRFPTVRIRAEIGMDPTAPSWAYELEFNAKQNQAPLITRERVWNREVLIVNRPNPEDQKDSKLLSQTHLEQINANRAFRDLAEFFASIRYLHVVPQLIRDPERTGLRKADAFGSDLIEQIANANQRTRKTRLTRITKALQIAVPQIEAVDLDQDARGFWHIRAKYQHWRPQGAWQTEENFSDGTLRLLGLLWSLQDKGGPLLLEEPELSLNEAIVRRIPALFARVQANGRQIIVTTHASDLLDDEGIGLDEVVLLMPEAEGTRIETAGSIEQVKALLEKGVPLGRPCCRGSVRADPSSSPSWTFDFVGHARGDQHRLRRNPRPYGAIQAAHRA